MKRFVLVCTIAVVAGAGPVLQAQEKSVPRYDGKTLDYWVERIQKAEKFEEQKAAAIAIKAFGANAAPAMPRLVEMLDDYSEGFRWMIVEIFRDLGPTAKAAVPALVRSLQEKKLRDPLEVIWILEMIGPEARDAVGVLTIRLDDPRLRYSCFKALGAIGPSAKSALPNLSDAIKELSNSKPNGEFIRCGIETLGRIGPESVPQLKELLEREDLTDGTNKCAAAALEQIGPPGKDTVLLLTRLLKSKDIELRIAAARGTLEHLKRKHKDALPTTVRDSQRHNRTNKVSNGRKSGMD